MKVNVEGTRPKGNGSRSKAETTGKTSRFPAVAQASRFIYIHKSREVNEARRPHTCSRPCAFKKKIGKKKQHEKIRPTENTTRNPHQPSDCNHSRQRATKRVPRVSPYLPDSIDPVFMAIGLVQLSQSVKTTNVTHTDRRTY